LDDVSTRSVVLLQTRQVDVFVWDIVDVVIDHDVVVVYACEYPVHRGFGGLYDLIVDVEVGWFVPTRFARGSLAFVSRAEGNEIEYHLYIIQDFYL